MNKTILSIALLLCGSVFSQDLSQHLLLKYPFDGTTLDVSPNAYHATPFNVSYVPDRFGVPESACYFNGIDSYVNFPNLLALKPALPVSFSFWIRYDATAYQKQVVFNTSMEENHATSVVFNTTGNGNYAINWADGAYTYGPDSRRTYASNIVADTMQWHFITIVVVAESDMKIYVDCEEAGGIYSGTGGPLVYSAFPGCLGRHDRSNSLPADYFLGTIDDFQYWDKALTAPDIEAICDGALSVATLKSPEVTIYPNPAKSEIFVQTKAPFKVATLFNLLGQKIIETKSTALNVEHVASGSYLLVIQTEAGVTSKKIIIQ